MQPLTNLKIKIYSACDDALQTKSREFKKTLSELTSGVENDSKSSAGDKHETARAMMQLEFEKIKNQLSETEMQLESLAKIECNIQHLTVANGCLIKTDTIYLFLSIGMGKITVEEKTIILLSPQSPLGAKLLGLKKNDTAELNGNKYIIKELI